MKKILLGLFFAMFAMQVNAAVLTLSDADTDVGDNLVVLGSGSGQFVAGIAGDLAPIVHDWGLVATGGNAAVTVTVDGNDTYTPVTNLELFLASNVSGPSLATLSFDTINVFSFNYLLMSGVDYIVRVTGTAPAAYSISAETPLPAAVWLFGSALMGLFGASRRKSTAVAA